MRTIIALTVLALLSGCGGDDEASDTAASATTGAATTTTGTATTTTGAATTTTGTATTTTGAATTTTTESGESTDDGAGSSSTGWDFDSCDLSECECVRDCAAAHTEQGPPPGYFLEYTDGVFLCFPGLDPDAPERPPECDCFQGAFLIPSFCDGGR